MQGVDVWRASLDRSASEVSALHEILDAPERARAARFVNERDRRRYVVGRGSLRMLLGEYTRDDPARVALTTLPGGKPVLVSEDEWRPLHFNVSHCGELALFAFADREVGIDVERLAPTSDMEQVAAHFFSVDEVVAFGQLAGLERTRFFFRTWVRKEAYVKATGDGFAIDPARISVAGALPRGVRVQRGACIRRADASYSLHDLADIDDHVVAIALRAPDSTLHTRVARALCLRIDENVSFPG